MLRHLNEKNLLLYAAQNYKNPRFADIDEFNEDLKRFKYIKRLFKKYIANKNITAVTKVKGIALFINFLSPGLKDLSNSKIRVIECLIE